jgi:hypothetical protein
MRPRYYSSVDSAFDYQLRILECPRCGAPLRCPREGGAPTCAYCGSTANVGPRAPHAPATAGAGKSEEERIALLWTQRDDASSASYFRPTPPGLERFERMNIGPEEAIPWLRDEWRSILVRMRLGRSPALESRALWIAAMLGSQYGMATDYLRRRAILESALELLTDENARHVLRCYLSRGAVLLSDLPSAVAWLAEADPRSLSLEVDSERRSAAATLACACGRWQEALDAVGRTSLAVPLAPYIDEQVAWIRVHALEESRDLQAAEAALHELAARVGRPAYASRLRQGPFGFGTKTLDRVGEGGSGNNPPRRTYDYG